MSNSPAREHVNGGGGMGYQLVEDEEAYFGAIATHRIAKAADVSSFLRNADTIARLHTSLVALSSIKTENSPDKAFCEWGGGHDSA
ncbi:hypothetical protein ON010_g8754 [Phytophthora cinnamomi]|nr:hypothetical protein ON010_g8754 [Phytophthora cinnamomi]